MGRANHQQLQPRTDVSGVGLATLLACQNGNEADLVVVETVFIPTWL
jgi:hypothetical protein